MTALSSHHQCPGAGCTRTVPNRMIACRTHWYWVSKATRDRVWATYYAGRGSDEHLDAIADAITEMNSR
jgi:hypothetical protein